MKQWSRKQKVIVIAVFAVILLVAGIGAGALNREQTQDGLKHFSVEIVSERDNYSSAADCESEEEILGGYLRTLEGCEWQESEYGIYITGFEGMKEDMDNQYWWCILINGESATTGADEIPLQEGDTYRFELVQGW